MPIRHLTCLLFLCAFLFAQAQPPLDSLRKLANNKDLPPSERKKAMYTLASLYIYSHPDSTNFYAEQQLELASSTQDLSSQGLAMLMKAFFFRSKQKYEEAAASLYKGLEFCQQSRDSNRIGQLLYELGAFFYETGRLDSATQYFKRSLTIAEANEDPPQMAAPTAGLGLIAKDQGNLNEALSYYHRSIELLEMIGDNGRIAITYRNIAFIYVTKGDFEKGIEYCQRSIDIFEALGDKRQVAGGLNGIALVAYYEKDYSAALTYFQQALDLHQTFHAPKELSSVYGNRGMVQASLGNFAKALEDYSRSLDLVREMGNSSGEAHTLVNIASIYLKQGDDRKALAYQKESLQIFDAIGNQLEQVGVMRKIGNSHLILGEDSLALNMILKSLDLSRQIGAKREETNTLVALGSIYQSNGQDLKAKETLLQALQIAGEIDLNSTPNALIGLAQLALKNQAWREAYDYAQRSLDIAQTVHNISLISTSADILWQSQQALGQFEDALESYRLHIQMRDSLSSLDNERAIIRYEYQEKTLADSLENANVLALQVAETRRRTTVSYALLAGLLVALVLGILLWNRFSLTRKQKQVIENEKGKLDRAYSELNVANERLKELDTFKSNFFTNISHEFRTPLTVIKGMAQQVRQKPEDCLEKGIELIDRNTQSLLNLVNQILDLRKLESGKLTLHYLQTDIVTFFRQQTGLFESLSDAKGVKLEFASSLEALQIDFDPEKLGQIHSNLVSNALKFTPEGGSVQLSLEAIQDDQIRIRVADTGIGIPPAQLPLIFDRFYQADQSDTREGEGTGIGLALTKELVQLMKGNIQVESQEGQGTTFTILLPISRHASKVVEKPVELLPPVPISNGRSFPVGQLEIDQLAERPSLLIIEDNPDIVSYLYSLLEDQYELSSASNGQEGIDMAFELVPDLIISDVMMPHKNGYEVCEILKLDERSSHIPIVMLTAKADHSSRMEGYKRGADVYLAKPFNEEELSIRLEKLLEIRRTLQKRYQGGMVPEIQIEDPAIQLEDAFLMKARRCIQDHLDDSNYRGESLGKDLGMSRANLHRKLKALTGLSSSHFIRSVRIQQAKELMQNPVLQIAEIAYMTGFSQPNYFNRVFQEIEGTTPGEWREKNV